MSRYLHELFFLAAAIFAGSLGLRPAFKLVRLQLLWTGFLLLTCALLLLVGGEVPWLHQTLPNGLPALNTALRVVLWSVVALIGAMLLKFALSRWYFAETGQPRARKLFADLLAGLIYLVAGIGILNAIFGPPLSGLLATSGIVAVVVGLALQNTLADLFAGIALNVERPFRAGDWISMSGGPEGVIIEINWRATRIKTRAGDLAVVPNGVLARSVATNHYFPSPMHAVGVGVTFGSDLDPQIATEILLEAGRAVLLALADPGPSAWLLSSGPFGIAYELDFYIADYGDAPAATSDALREIWKSAKTKGVAFATPRQEILINETPNRRFRPRSSKDAMRLPASGALAERVGALPDENQIAPQLPAEHE